MFLGLLLNKTFISSYFNIQGANKRLGEQLIRTDRSLRWRRHWYPSRHTLWPERKRKHRTRRHVCQRTDNYGLGCGYQVTSFKTFPLNFPHYKSNFFRYEKSLEAEKKFEISIYHYESSCDNPTTWGVFMDKAEHYGINSPTIKAIWYYYITLQKNYLFYVLCTIFLHYLPAVLVDGALLCVGKSPRYVGYFLC